MFLCFLICRFESSKLVIMKKAFGKIGQSLAEKRGTRDKTQLDDEHNTLERYTEALKKGWEGILGAADDLIFPDGSQRSLMKLSKSRKYKQPESVLAKALTDAGRNIGTETGMLGGILEYMGEIEQQIGDAHGQCETDVSQMFVEPIQGYLNADIKEVINHKKKLHSRRLDFDAKRVAMQKKPELEESYRAAEAKFEESKELTMQGMTALVNGEAQQMSQLLALVDAQKNYHKSAATSLEGLSSYLEECLSKADALAPREFSSSRTESSHNQSQGTDAYGDERTEGAVGGSGQGRAVALYDFVAESDQEISFSEGDVITLTRQIDENWFEGALADGSMGIFPASYVDVEVPL